MSDRARSTIVFASDHGGVSLRELLMRHAQSLDCEIHDCGTNEFEPVDYPDLAKLAVSAFLRLKADFIVLVCGSGVGMSIAANRHFDVRAVLAANVDQARLSREHNHANCLCLGERLTSTDEAKKILESFIESTPDMSERHCRRVAKLEEQ